MTHRGPFQPLLFCDSVWFCDNTEELDEIMASASLLPWSSRVFTILYSLNMHSDASSQASLHIQKVQRAMLSPIAHYFVAVSSLLPWILEEHAYLKTKHTPHPPNQPPKTPK